MLREVYSLIVIAICIVVILALAFTNAVAFFWGQIVVQILMLLIAVEVTMGLIKERGEEGG